MDIQENAGEVSADKARGWRLESAGGEFGQGWAA